MNLSLTGLKESLRTLIIDGDSWAYRIALKANTPFGYSKSLAEQECKTVFKPLQAELNAPRIVLCMSDPTARYFRHDILPSYKSNRSQGQKPEGVDEVKEMLTKFHEANLILTLEADDVVGILGTLGHPDCILVSEDKDLLTIPGKHYNPRKGGDVFEVSPDEANYNHMMQTLTGDTCDGFKGCPLIGPVKAKKILDEGHADLWEAVVSAYELKGLTEADALVQARVARILRSTDWNADKQEVILWTPPSQSLPCLCC